MQKAKLAQHPGCNGTRGFTTVLTKAFRFSSLQRVRPARGPERHFANMLLFYDTQLLQQPNSELEDHPLSADPNCFTENVFFRNLKDSPRCADAENNQHGTTDGVKGTKTLYTREATNFLCWETRKFYQHFNASIQRLLSFPEHCDCHRMCRRTEALCVLRLPC